MLANPHDALPSFMHVVKYLRLQVSSIASPEQAQGCYEGAGQSGLSLCTVVLSTQPENSTSVQLLMGTEAPADAPILEASKEACGSLTVAVYQQDTRVAHAVIPLEQVWQVWPQLRSPGIAAVSPMQQDQVAERAWICRPL
jgi:hypothetical protein